VEASNLDEVELVLAGHAAGKADLDNARGKWDALSVTRSSFHLAASTAWPSFPGRPGASTSPRVSVSLA
jgi:hypothetical protein